MFVLLIVVRERARRRIRGITVYGYSCWCDGFWTFGTVLVAAAYGSVVAFFCDCALTSRCSWIPVILFWLPTVRTLPAFNR
jgi:hypothetical protein